TPDLQVVMTDCSNYAFTGPSVRPSFAPGLTYKVTVQSRYAVDNAASGDLSRVHTVPDPYYVTNNLEATANTKILKFVNLPSRAIIRIYSLSGILVQVLTHNDPGGSGEATWNLRNRNNQFVASGVYFYHVEGPDGKTKVGRFTVVNFAP
ncbi:MAG TPA: T9SS type A sorting domain-containing protein, partial [Gemmatimonadales bacterium]|nr:T9SS type A sorting domain-containing protein [Gemmatimonadales bacterium]